MGAGRIETEGASLRLNAAGLWLSGAPLDTLGRAAAELARRPGVAGVLCAPAGSQRDAAREDALRALADALEGRPLVAAPRQGADWDRFLARLGRPNVLLPTAEAPRAGTLAASARPACLGPLHAPGRLDALLEAWLSGLEERARAKRDLAGCAAAFHVDAVRLERTYDAIAYARMDAAPTDSIRAAYRLLVGRVGWAVAAACRRRLATAVNSARFVSLRKLGAQSPLLLVETTVERLAEFAAPETALAVRYEAAELPPAPAGRALEDGYDEAKRLLDKLANYQIDMDAIAGELEAAA